MGKQKPRLYSKGVVMGYQRSKTNQRPNVSLIKIEGVRTKKETKFYLGKKVAYIYRVQKAKQKNQRSRIIWGKVCKSHGNSGVVRCRFTSNLPTTSFGAPCRVMLYPSNI
ncbi:ribosomal protein L35A [Anaeramoeba ignava]|uniref:Ribosomal protein L35A n=1 Tax=Anaeramoeba ignava TaxID=1746090 RepID=A0A9Q0LJ29_ANAIG|nr:ribosomal protein L35A [Anaeramoeba ignava]|eukprot:Anaeramoba_ignava/a2506_223.p1 GENE.a2506_223~~a2506_223.p1  ORF type:complete len:110 (+),score=30.43 a2506_223:32-361(+)